MIRIKPRINDLRIISVGIKFTYIVDSFNKAGWDIPVIPDQLCKEANKFKWE